MSYESCKPHELVCNRANSYIPIVRRLGKVIANAKKEANNSNTQNNYACRGDNLYRGIPALGRNMGLDNTIT